MVGVRLGRALAVCASGRNRRGSRTAAAMAVSLAAVLGAVFALVPASAWAEPLCTDTWTGPAEGTWQTAADWSTEHVPTSSDIACMGSGKTVKVTAGTDQASVVQGEGALVISGGSLELTNSLVEEASRIHSLILEGGTLTGAATLNVSEAFTWTGGTMSGSGATVLESGASGSINPGSGVSVALTARTLSNDGDLTWSSGSVEGRSSAEIDNNGTLIANADASGSEWWEHGLLKGDGSAVWLHNTGTVKKTAGSLFTQIQFQIDNEGAVEAKTGQIILAGGNHGGTAQGGSWAGVEGGGVAFDSGSYILGSGAGMAGVVFLAGGSVEAADIQGPEATLWLWGGGSTLTLTNTSTVSHLGTLNIQASTMLTGPATLDIASSFSGGESGRMEGTGSTVIEPGASGSIVENMFFYIAERTLVNEGSLTVSLKATIVGREGAAVVNHGTLTVNGEGEFKGMIFESPGPEPALTNTGTVQKTEGSGTTPIRFAVDNEGTISTTSGKLEFTGGGTSGVENQDRGRPVPALRLRFATLALPWVRLCHWPG